MKASKLTKASLLVITLSIAFIFKCDAQKSDYEHSIDDIKATFGLVPEFFQKFPKNVLPSAWESFKVLTGSETALQGKEKELIGLAVAAQIPCNYCVYFHTEAAKAYGATEEEILETVAIAASTRHWSTVLNGAQIEFDSFKEEFKQMMEYMASNAK